MDVDEQHIDQAVVLAAGEGSRLRPLTERVPKPLLPIDGEPVLGRVLDQLRSVGVETVTIVVGHLAAAVEQFARDHAADLSLRFVDQPVRRGTADALQLALAGGHGRRASIVCAADTAWRDDDVAALLRDHAASGAVATMAVQRWPVAQLPHASAVRAGGDGVVERVLEPVDPAGGGSAPSGSPLYAFGASMWERVAAVKPSPGGAVELWRALQAAIDDGEPVRAFEVQRARDLTSPDDLLRHNFPYLGAWLDTANSPG